MAFGAIAVRILHKFFFTRIYLQVFHFILMVFVFFVVYLTKSVSQVKTN